MRRSLQNCCWLHKIKNSVGGIVSLEEPSPQTTVAILLGASDWPEHSQLAGSPAFRASANKIRNYFRNPDLFGLPSENWLDLFDQHQENPYEVDLRISNFLSSRLAQMKQAGMPAKDLLFYYIGHGVFTQDSEQAYHLAIRSTRKENIGASAVATASLAYTLKTQARYLRRIVILDCCFAAKAFPHLAQSAAVEQAALLQTQAAFEEKRKGSGFPKKGTTLLGSSGPRELSFLLPDESGTMFSDALIRVLTKGDVHQPGRTHFSLYELKSLTEEALQTETNGSAPRPFISSPDQSEGDVASIPFFPNPLARKERRFQERPVHLETQPQEKPTLSREQRPVSNKRVRMDLQQMKEAASSPDPRKRADAYRALTDLMLENPTLARETFNARQKQIQVSRQPQAKPLSVSAKKPGIMWLPVMTMIISLCVFIYGVYQAIEQLTNMLNLPGSLAFLFGSMLDALMGDVYLALSSLVFMLISRSNDSFFRMTKARRAEYMIAGLVCSIALVFGVIVIYLRITTRLLVDVYDAVPVSIFLCIFSIITFWVTHLRIKNAS